MLQTKPLAEPTFVGREQELSDLNQALDDALAGKGETVFISGEAGSGKTRLTNEFTNLVKSKGIELLFGWCLSSADIPFFPFIEAFNSYIQNSEEKNASISSLSPHLKLISWLRENGQNEKKESLSPQIWRDQIFAAVTKELLYMTTAKPIVLILEDLHWADTASLALLHYISRALASERILVLANFRNEELSNDTTGYPHPLKETLRLMNREGLFKEIRIPKLTLENVGRIAESMLGDPIEPKLIQRLSEESKGNPLFIVESVRMLNENGSLTKNKNQWQLTGTKTGIPFRVKEIILRRVEALKTDQRRILDVASVIGDKFDSDLIGKVLNQDSLTVLESLNNVLHSKSLVRVQENCFTFDHAMSREVLYEEISSPLKQGYHERIAEHMESQQNKKKFSASELAYHYVKATNVQKSIEYSMEAGREALERYSNAEAIKYFNWILQNVLDNPGNSKERQDAMLGLGDAYHANNMFKDAINTFENLATISLGHVRQQALSKAMDAAFSRGDFNKVFQLVIIAEEYDGLDRLEKAHILHYKGAAINNLRGLAKEGQKLCEESLKIFEEEYALSNAAWMMFAVADFASAFGELEKAVALSLRSITLFDELGDLRSKMEAYNEAGRVFQNCGLYPEAQKMFQSVIKIEQETKMGNHIMIAKADSYLSLYFEGKGEVANAIKLNLEALENSKKADSQLLLVRIYANLVRQYVKQNDLALAEEYFGKLTNIMTSISKVSSAFIYALAQAALFVGKNQVTQSIKIFDQYLPMFRTKITNPTLQILPLTEYAWILNKAGHFEEEKKILHSIAELAMNCDLTFKNGNVQTYVLTPSEISTKEPLKARIEIVNTSRAKCSLTNLQLSIPSDIEVLDFPNDRVGKCIINFKQEILEPFSVKVLTLRLQPTVAGIFKLTYEVKYLNDLGETKMCKSEPINITVSSPDHKNLPTESTNSVTVNENQLASKPSNEPEKFHFEIQAAEKTFNFLITAFIEDYMRRRLAPEKAGWRTLMEVVTHEKIPKSSMYGYEKRKGKALIELEKRGLVEFRFFPGERGRGGRIQRVRVCYDKEIIKRQIDNRIIGKE
jgi:tetratricopeptide (TPR) repeat protein